MSNQTQQQSPTPEEIAAILAQKQQQHQARIQKAYNFVTGADPLVLLGLGTLVLLMWTIASVTQIQTSEMLAMHAGRMPVQVEWGVILQPYQLVTGTVPVQYMGPYCYGWIIQTITLIWAYALEHAVQKLHETNKHLGKWYGIISLLLISLNSWADYNNLPGSDPLVQALMAVAIGLMAVAGLPVGLVVLKAGLAKMGASK